MAEIERAAMIAAVHRHDLLPAGEAARRGQRHHVGFRAGIGEAHEVHVEALRNHLGKLHLALVMRAIVQAIVERSLGGRDDARVRVAVDACRVFAQQVEIAVAVDVGDGGAFGLLHAQGERCGKQHRAGVATGHHVGCTFMHGTGLRAPGRETGAGLGERLLDILHGHQAVALSPIGGAKVRCMSQGR